MPLKLTEIQNMNQHKCHWQGQQNQSLVVCGISTESWADRPGAFYVTMCYYNPVSQHDQWNWRNNSTQQLSFNIAYSHPQIPLFWWWYSWTATIHPTQSKKTRQGLALTRTHIFSAQGMRALPGQIKSVTRILQPFQMSWCGIGFYSIGLYCCGVVLYLYGTEQHDCMEPV